MELHAHRSIYAMYPGVQSVIHSHCLSAIVYGLCNGWNSMRQPSYLMAGFLGPSPPIFDIARFYDYLPQSHPRNLLISNQFLGDAMARRSESRMTMRYACLTDRRTFPSRMWSSSVATATRRGQRASKMLCGGRYMSAGPRTFRLPR